MRQLYHLMNFFLECGHPSSLCWLDMTMAAVYVMNRFPHPQSTLHRRHGASPYESMDRRKPDLSNLIAGPGELVIVNWIGIKASAGEQTGERSYYIMPTGQCRQPGALILHAQDQGHQVRQDAHRPRPDCAVPGVPVLHDSNRMYRDGSSFAGAPAAAMASASL